MGRLIIVEDAFDFGDGGIHVAPCVPDDVLQPERVRQGDLLELIKPDGTRVTATLLSFDFLIPHRAGAGFA